MPSGPLPTGTTVWFHASGLAPRSNTLIESDPMLAVKILLLSLLSSTMCVPVWPVPITQSQ